MKLLLVKTARINHNAGEIVEVSPAQANFLLSVGAAVVIKPDVREIPEKPKTTRKAVKK